MRTGIKFFCGNYKQIIMRSDGKNIHFRNKVILTIIFNRGFMLFHVIDIQYKNQVRMSKSVLACNNDDNRLNEGNTDDNRLIEDNTDDKRPHEGNTDVNFKFNRTQS